MAAMRRCAVASLSGCAVAIMAVLAWCADSATATQKNPPKKTAAAARRGGKKSPVKRTTWRNRQLAPTPERYKEIQGALVAKGCLRPEDAGGSWNQASIDALKKFQSEQNLESSGKINSLSLIALGMGPRREKSPALEKSPDVVKPPVPDPGQE